MLILAGKNRGVKQPLQIAKLGFKHTSVDKLKQANPARGSADKHWTQRRREAVDHDGLPPFARRGTGEFFIGVTEPAQRFIPTVESHIGGAATAFKLLQRNVDAHHPLKSLKRHAMVL